MRALYISGGNRVPGRAKSMRIPELTPVGAVLQAKDRNFLINDRSRGGGHAKMSRRAETALFPIKGDLPFVYRD
jgi:hypothetical protein